MRLFRRWQQISRDPEFPFQIGRLLGASEMIGHFLSAAEDPQTRQYGQVMLEHVSRFWAEIGESQPVAELLPGPQEKGQ